VSQIPNQDKSFGKDGRRDLRLPRNKASSYAAAEQDSLPAWVSKWGLVAFVLATSGFLAASLLDVAWPTILLEVLALAAVGWGVTQLRDGKDRAWLTVSGGLAALVLLLALFYPVAINNRWAINRAVVQVDPAKQLAVPRDKPKAEGKNLAATDWANAETDSIRQDDLVTTIDMANVSEMPGKNTPFGLIHVEFANIGARTLVFHGFDHDKHMPILADENGRSFAFKELRQRLPAKDDPAFDKSPFTGTLNLTPTNTQGFLLMFEAPPATFKNLKLELPGSAWGKPGAFRFILAHSF